MVSQMNARTCVPKLTISTSTGESISLLFTEGGQILLLVYLLALADFAVMLPQAELQHSVDSQQVGLELGVAQHGRSSVVPDLLWGKNKRRSYAYCAASSTLLLLSIEY